MPSRTRLPFIAALLFALTPSMQAAVPAGFSESTYVSGLNQPTQMAFAPDGRLFICEKSGRVRVVTAAGALLSTPFVDLTSKISQGNERGLLGITFDPNFSANGFVYVFYTANSPAVHSRVSRLTANGDVAAAGSEVEIFNMSNLSTNENHNGGSIHFGGDGKLYVASGDNRTPSNSQSFSNTHGKIHRLNADGTIPSDNPYLSQTTGAQRAIYALGFRNPFTFGVQPGTGRIFINDVGEGTQEEISDLHGGMNYGWPTCEGTACSGTPPSPYMAPLHSYGRSVGNCITGGAFYNPPAATFPSSYAGDYFFSDAGVGWVRTLDPANGNAVADFGTGFNGPVDIDVGPDGALYVASVSGGRVIKVQYTLNQAPQIAVHPANQTAGSGQTATFTVSAAGTPPLSYQWQRNNSNIGGATGASYTTPVLTVADSGATYRVIVSNSFGNATSNAATLTVTGQAPVAVIQTPAAGALYTAGQAVTFSGTATDAEDGTLPASAFTWDVEFHHQDPGTGGHAHPADPPVSGGTSGSFTPSQTEEFSPNVWFRLHLSVRDSAGLTHAIFRDVLPRKSTMTFATNPAGLSLNLDGIPMTAPRTVVGVQGVIRSLDAPAQQTLNGTTYEFVSWSDGGARVHNVTTPAGNNTFTATYRVLPTADLLPPDPPKNFQRR